MSVYTIKEENGEEEYDEAELERAKEIMDTGETENIQNVIKGV